MSTPPSSTRNTHTVDDYPYDNRACSPRTGTEPSRSFRRASSTTVQPGLPTPPQEDHFTPPVSVLPGMPRTPLRAQEGLLPYDPGFGLHNNPISVRPPRTSSPVPPEQPVYRHPAGSVPLVEPVLGSHAPVRIPCNLVDLLSVESSRRPTPQTGAHPVPTRRRPSLNPRRQHQDVPHPRHVLPSRLADTRLLKPFR